VLFVLLSVPALDPLSCFVVEEAGLREIAMHNAMQKIGQLPIWAIAHSLESHLCVASRSCLFVAVKWPVGVLATTTARRRLAGHHRGDHAHLVQISFPLSLHMLLMLPLSEAGILCRML